MDVKLVGAERDWLEAFPEDLYQLISNIGIFEVRARPSPYIRIYGSFEEPYIRIYGFLWPFCNGPRIRVSSILVLVVQVTTRIRRRRIRFLQVA